MSPIDVWGGNVRTFHFCVKKRQESRINLKIKSSGFVNRLGVGCDNSQCKDSETKEFLISFRRGKARQEIGEVMAGPYV